MFTEDVSRFVLNYVNYFSVTTVASTSSPTSLTDMSSVCSTYSTTDVSVWSSVIPYGSITSSSFKIASNSLIMTPLLKNSSTSISFISEFPTLWFVGVLYFTSNLWEDLQKGFSSH